MNNIGFGIFCFGEEYYYKGTIEKIKKILNEGFHCYVLTENPDYINRYFSSMYLHVIEYNREFKSYADKMLLPKHILKQHQIAILIDADTHIKDYSFLRTLKTHSFKEGISYIDTLLNHKSKREFVKDLISPEQIEWKTYCEYVNKIFPNYGELETMWEYFLIINKSGFNSKNFYSHLEKLQIVKEYSDIDFNKDVNCAGEGISINISSRLSNTPIQRDLDLYEILKDKMESVSRRYTPPHLWPDWMK